MVVATIFRTLVVRLVSGRQPAVRSAIVLASFGSVNDLSHF